MADISHFFPLTVYKSKVGLGESYRERIIKEITQNYESNNADAKNSSSSWTGDLNGFEFLHTVEVFENLFKEISKHIEAYRQTLNISDNIFDFYYTRSWATMTHEQQNINLHQHMQSHISAVYYPKMPKDSGGLILEPFTRDSQNEFIPGLLRKQNFVDGFIEPSLFLSPGASINVETDDILIFPSKTRHGTQNSDSKESRISIAADIVAVLKDSGSKEYFYPPLEMWRKF